MAKSKKQRAKEKKAKLQKKKQQKFNDIPKIMSPKEFQKQIDLIKPMANEANQRIEMLQVSPYQSYALNRVIEERETDYFDLTEVKTRSDLLTIITQMKVFLSSKSSTIEGAILETAEMQGEQYRGQFGNQYFNAENGFKRYNTKVIDNDIAKEVFRNYRRIEEIRAVDIVNDGGYGSENLIVAMYDAQVKGLDSYEYGEDLLDAFVREYNEQWQDVDDEMESIMAMSNLVENNLKGWNL